MDTAFLGFEPGSILALQNLCATDVASSTLPKKLGYLIKVNQRGYSTPWLEWGGTLCIFLLPAVHFWMELRNIGSMQYLGLET